MSNPTPETAGEMADFATLLAEQRHTFLIPMRNLTEEQSRTRSTASTLTLASLLKHVTATERHWIATILAPDENAVFDMASGTDSHTVGPEETFEGLLAAFHANAATTDAALARIDPAAMVPIPLAPWQPERQSWTARRILLHLLREISQHSGHADIIREALDGANTTWTMGADAGMDFS